MTDLVKRAPDGLVADPTEGLVPQHDIDAEAAVISAVLLDPAALPLIEDFLRGEHFFSEAHRRIYEAAVQVRSTGSPIDAQTVASRLNDTQRLAQVGGVPYIGRILDSSPVVANVRAYAVIVYERWRLRRLTVLGREMSVRAFGPISDVQEFAAQCSRAVTEVARQGPGIRLETNIETLRKLVKRINEASRRPEDHGKRFGIRTGIYSYDQKTLGLHASQKTTIVALPGRGKSTLGLQIAMNVARQDIGVALFSPEMDRSELGEKQLSALASIDSRRLRLATMKPTLTADEWQRLMLALDSAGGIREALTIYDDPQMTVEDVCAMSKLQADQAATTGRPLGLVVVDHLHRLAVSPIVERKKRHEQLAHATTMLAILAKELKIPVIELAQERKEHDRNGRPVKPYLGRVFECSKVEQESHNVVYIWRPDDRDLRRTTLLLVKVRSAGQEDEVDLIFEREFSRFVDPNEPNPMACPSRQYVDTAPPMKRPTVSVAPTSDPRLPPEPHDEDDYDDNPMTGGL